jgi:hypothetical protein
VSEENVELDPGRRAVVFRWFNDPAEALEAVGLAG